MPNNQPKVVIMLTVLIALASCGTKGPLYIPEQRYPQEPLPQTEIKQRPADEATQATPEANSGETSSPAP